MNLLEAADQFGHLSSLLDEGLDEMRDQAHSLAEAENAYRKQKAASWLMAPKATVPEREAWVNAKCADLRRTRDLAEGMSRAALEAVRSRRTQISALQTLLNAHQEELKMARTGPVAA